MGIEDIAPECNCGTRTKKHRSLCANTPTYAGLCLEIVDPDMLSQELNSAKVKLNGAVVGRILNVQY